MAENRKGVFGLLKSLLSRSGDLYGSVYVKRFGPVRMITIGTAAGKNAGTLPAKDLPIDIVGVYGKVYNGSSYVDCIVSIDKTTGEVTITDLYGGAISGMQIGYMRPRSITYLANWGGYGLTSILSRLAERWWKYEDSTETANEDFHRNKRAEGSQRRCNRVPSRENENRAVRQSVGMVCDFVREGQTFNFRQSVWMYIQRLKLCNVCSICWHRWSSKNTGLLWSDNIRRSVRVCYSSPHNLLRGIGRISEGRCAA